VEEILELSDFGILFIDDGSTDNSSLILHDFTQDVQNVTFLKLEKNVGKANALRLGLLWAYSNRYDFAITLDFDNSQNLKEITSILNQVEIFKDFDIASWARVNLASNNVNRTQSRLWISRILVTISFLISKIPLYDPQSPTKVYKLTSKLFELIEKEFETRWFFDVELFMRSEKNSHSEIKYKENILNFWNDNSTKSFSGAGTYRVLKDLYKLLYLSIRLKNL
jgi:glycosyltransferase involved in cell wall biosynthesis